MFLSGAPSTISSTGQRTGAERTSQSFNGCIHNVRINGELQELNTGLTGTEGILPGCHSCSVCAQGPCRQRGETGVTCECPASSSSPLCDQQSYTSPCQSSRYCNPTCINTLSFYFLLLYIYGFDLYSGTYLNRTLHAEKAEKIVHTFITSI